MPKRAAGGRVAAAFFFRLIEQLAVRFFDHLITASPAIHHGFASRPATLISNYPLIDPNRDFPQKETGAIHFVYAGTMEENLGIREMLLGFSKITDRTSRPVRLQIAGWLKGSDEYQCELRQLFTHPDIIYHGGLSFKAARDLMRSSHVGVIPYLPSDMMLKLVSHKLFNYMEAGLTILASEFPGWPEDLLKWEIGMLFNPRDISSIAAVMSAAASAPEELEAKGRRAFQLVGEKFTWESQELQIFSAYEQVES